jgi:hypothetical protein
VAECSGFYTPPDPQASRRLGPMGSNPILSSTIRTTDWQQLPPAPLGPTPWDMVQSNEPSRHMTPDVKVYNPNA